MTVVINKIVKVPSTIKPIDLQMLYNAKGGFFFGTKKECDEYIKKNNLMVLEKLTRFPKPNEWIRQVNDN